MILSSFCYITNNRIAETVLKPPPETTTLTAIDLADRSSCCGSPWLPAFSAKIYLSFSRCATPYHQQTMRWHTSSPIISFAKVHLGLHPGDKSIARNVEIWLVLDGNEIKPRIFQSRNEKCQISREIPCCFYSIRSLFKRSKAQCRFIATYKSQINLGREQDFFPPLKEKII